MAFAITAVFLAIWNRKKNKWGHVALFVEHMIDKSTGIAESVQNSTGSTAASKSCFFYICILVHNEIFIFYILFWSVHKWTLFVWYFLYNFFISARFHHWQIKHFQFFEARLLYLRFRRFGAFAIFPGAFINHVIYMLEKQSNMTSFIIFAIPYSYENSCKSLFDQLIQIKNTQWPLKRFYNLLDSLEVA